MSLKPALGRLRGQRVYFHGKFLWGVKERLAEMAEAHQGTVVDALDVKTNYLVLPDLAGGKTIQKQALALNAKGATIQVTSVDDFTTRLRPTVDEAIAVLKAGGAQNPSAKIFPGSQYPYQTPAPQYVITLESFRNADLSRLCLEEVAFDRCDFVGAKLPACVGSVTDCDFNKASTDTSVFGDIFQSTFVGAKLNQARFINKIRDCDFTDAAISHSVFARFQFALQAASTAAPAASGLVFRRASFTETSFDEASFSAPDFESADARRCSFALATFTDANFRKARLTGSTFAGAKLLNADFSKADLRDVSFGDADLTGAKFDGANVAGADFRGATVSEQALAVAKGFDPGAMHGRPLGPAQVELDDIVSKAKRIQIEFRIEGGPKNDNRVTIDSASLQYGYGVFGPIRRLLSRWMPPKQAPTMSETLRQAARSLGDTRIRFETIEISTTKSPVNATKLRDVVIRALAEAFEQEPPEEAKLAELTKAWREEQRAATATERAEREKARLEAEKLAEKQKKAAKKQIKKQVGKVTDIATFLKALELRTDKAKLDKATKMLKAERFQLFNDVTDEFVMGVVKSQTDPDLVYACRINHEGVYACCTQNLNICGGLCGSPCKHLLVLIIGLVHAGKLDPTTIDDWVAKAHDAKPVLDKELMGEIFIRYKGAEAGEVDWRPTETLPEDYYAL